MAHELGKFGITVNCVAPGFVLSNPTTQKQWESYGADGQRALLEKIAVRRTGTSEDIARGVRFFVAPDASWVSGQVLSIDGGARTREGYCSNHKSGRSQRTSSGPLFLY